MAKPRPPLKNPAAARSATPAAARRARLDALRQQAQDIILARQDAGTGLLPASTAITVHGDYTHAWVRDNVYSILAVWALAQAYRTIDAASAAPLEDAVVRLMRGLLAAMKRQAHKVERFKHSQAPLDALHAKYDTQRGEPVVGDDAWGHLQIDATALYLLLLAQMSAGGLRIIQQAEEAAFVQNLAYYLARAWCTPDYGIWERGHKGNLGVAELNASSVGMAKAALEAIAGFEPLPGQALPVLVAADDIAHARNTLAALLPRESESKETDAALLSIVGFPGFAVDDAALADRTRATLLAKLQGRWGCKRFLRDGHQTVLEDHARLHYEPGELQQFQHIESEWPLFFTYLLVDAALAGQPEEAATWRQRLDGLMQPRDDQLLLPELYFVPAGAVDAERAQPGSQPREANANVPLVWAQSLYLVGVLLQEGFVTPTDLDPLGRRSAASLTPEVCVQLCLLAEDDLVCSRLAALGLRTETLAAVQPLQLCDAEQLAARLATLGSHAGLGLSGRPPRPLGSLATSQVFEGDGRLTLCLPAFWRRSGFYLALDNRLLAGQIDAEIAYLRQHWRPAGPQPSLPLLPLLLTGAMLDAPGADALLACLARHAGTAPSAAEGAAATVRVGPLQSLLPLARRCRLDGLGGLDGLDGPGSASGVAHAGGASAAPPDGAAAPAAAPGAPAAAMLAWDEAATRPLTTERAAALVAATDAGALLPALARCRNPYEQADLLAALWRLAGPGHDTGLGGDVRQLTEALYARASQVRRWGVMRRAAGLLELHDDALEDAVAEIVVRGKRVALGRAYSADSVVARPLANEALWQRLQKHGGKDPRGRVLIEEIVLLLGRLMRSDAALFAGTLTLRPWQAVLLLTAWLAREHGVSQAEALSHLLDLSPHAILGRLREVVSREQEMAANLVRLQSLHSPGGGGALGEITFSAASDPPLAPDQGGWPGWRQTSGVMARVPDDFHPRVWALLQHCDGLVIGDQLDGRNRIHSALARADTTPGERSFALQVEELLSRIQAPEYRQLVIEALLTLSDIARASPALKISEPLVLDVLIGIAVRLGWAQGGGSGAYSEQVALAWQAFYASPPHRVATLIAAALRFLLTEAERADAQQAADAAKAAGLAPPVEPPAATAAPAAPTAPLSGPDEPPREAHAPP